MNPAPGGMSKKISISVLPVDLFPFILIFLDLNIFSKWNLFFVIDVIKGLSIYLVVTPSLIEKFSLFSTILNISHLSNIKFLIPRVVSGFITCLLFLMPVTLTIALPLVA